MINLPSLAQQSDAITLCAFIGAPEDLYKIDYYQGLSRDWNQHFNRSVISINYRNPILREEQQKNVEGLFKSHFKQPHFIHNKENWTTMCRSYCNMEENLLQECKKLGYGLVCKSMDHVSILPEIEEVEVPTGKDFYHTNGLGIGGC